MGVTAGNAKEKELKEWFASLQAECCGLVETNVYWGKCRDCARFNKRMKYGPWEYMRSSTAYNKNEYTSLSQYGGVAMLCFDQLAHWSGGSGSDERGLGSWTWMFFSREEQCAHSDCICISTK